SYLLNITTIDPIKYDLGFERFLNPNRKTMPDIDTDFEDTKREEVVEYLREKYGKERVANIISFQTILAKQALRDIGRVYGYKTQHIDLLTKSLLDKNLSLGESYKKIKEFRELVDSDKYFLEIVSLAYKIEFLPRQNGMHASGYILNKDPLETCLPVICDYEDNYISQYEFIYLEEQGFLKMDLLGIRNLSIISSTCDLINKNGNKIDKFNVPYDEPCVFELLNTLSTMGIFQLESSGMRNVIKNVKPTCFDDISAIIALYRPGPMPNIDLYAKRKNNNIKIEYISEDVKKILSPTYGIIVYQEQISQLAEVMAGFSKIDADSFRQAISKKKGDVLHSLKENFINGAINKGYSKEDALKTFDSIDKFESYGFNKPHSVAYAKFACQMAYLKAKYPKEFYISLLDNVSINNDTKFIDYLFEMKKGGINILLPDINKSDKSFQIEGNNLLYPLTGIKGINNIIIDKIIEERNNGLFEDFYDFIIRMYRYKISENQIIQLINSGSFDKLHKSRETLRNSIQTGIKYAKLITTKDGEINLDLGFNKPLLNEARDLEIDNLEKEYDAIGVNLSKNPLELHEQLLEKYHRTKINEIKKINTSYNIVGIIRSCKRITTKKGTNMAFLKIFDETGEIESIIFSDLYSKSYQFLVKNKVVLIKGIYSFRNNETSFIANDISILEEINYE
ncbi:MAG: DNA polymerase III subunit alpha, partial [Bacilli bacterium]